MNDYNLDYFIIALVLIIICAAAAADQRDVSFSRGLILLCAYSVKRIFHYVCEGEEYCE
jgi:hypothetical protein